MTTEIAESEIPIIELAASGVAVVGFAEGHLHEAPFDEPDWELWGINRLHTVDAVKQKQFHRWFQIHDLEKFHGEDSEHLEFLKQFNGPVYLRPQDVGKYPIPNAVPFPADQLVRQFGGYFNNTISWLIAYAIAHKPKKLGVYGVDMAQDHILNAEYSVQRPSCEYFLGLAQGLGIELHMPVGSDLLKSTHLYGFEDASAFTSKALSRLQEVGQRKEQAKQQMMQLDAQIQQLNGQKQEVYGAINQLDGAMQDCQYWLRNWVPQYEGVPVVESPNGKAEVDASQIGNGKHSDRSVRAG
jgi:hypothetical protein